MVNAHAPAGMACPKPSSCLNRGRLVFDTDSIVFLINGIVLFVRETYRDLRTWDQKIPVVIDAFNEVASIFRMCAADGELHTSESVLAEELDLVSPSRSVQKWLPVSHLRNVRKRHRTQLQMALSAVLTPFTADDDLIESLRQTFAPGVRPANRDASVLLAACELGHEGGRTLLVAHDHGYHEPIRKLRRRSNVTLTGGRTLATGQLEHRPYESFLLTAHESCCLDSERFACLARAFYEPQLQRSVKLENGRRGTRILGEILPFVREQTQSLERKAASACFPGWAN